VAATATATAILAADSWLVVDGAALTLSLHHDRFLAAVDAVIDSGVYPSLHPGWAAEAERFWNTTIAEIPREGEWFPRVQLQSVEGVQSFASLSRPAPPRTRSAVVASHRGADPRTHPTLKGPDLERMLSIRQQAQERGADEAIILSPEGYVVEGAYSALVWWRGSILCTPSAELARIDSVTAKALLSLAAALGTELHTESVTPSELDGTELWALSALHGPRIVTRWVDGPQLAELPGRLALWRSRLEALRRPLR
jgi:hypothetical protein